MTADIDGNFSLEAIIARQIEQQTMIDALSETVRELRLEVEMLKNAGHETSIKIDPKLGAWTGA